MSEYHSSKQLRRTHKGRILGGVCSGVGEYVGIDPNIIRIGLAIVTLFGGLGIGVYAIGWLLLPEEGKDTSIVQDLLAKQQQKSSSTGSPWTEDDHKPRQ
ncbi:MULTISPECIES: PspC domain-containing protein [Nonomuraea]|uniref:PspC domain-containing protein n=2 Tax=Nonomuraea TaxID=83681 RepID=A0ABW1BLY9_9ACTN|nr:MULTISPECIES: PspC domain-containing protein [Nonomuraea]MDA0642573.1 PspC domain-containing protein [Nonomuraea ferruginea]TXK34256.1 PspC domain-containing protein [Nonomuraea sp. C10]